MIKGKDIVVIGIQPWDIEIGSNCKDIAKEFSKNNRVLFVNIPISYLEAWKNSDNKIVKNRKAVIKNPSLSIKQINENLFNLTPATYIHPSNSFPGFLFKMINKQNNKKLAISIKKATYELGFKDILLFNDQHMFLGFSLKELLNPKLSIYYIRDNLLIVPYWRKHGLQMEPYLIAKSDIVFTNSLYYEEYARKYNENSFMVGQGCDVSIYQPDRTEVSEELKSIDKPIIGYVGYLSTKRLDVNLIAGIAKAKPDFEIVLVGPENESFKKTELHHISNVTFLGPRPPETLPSYIKGFTIAMNPQQLTKATIGNYPRKIDEYLAMGIPTIATKTKAMKWFKDTVMLGETLEDYLENIDLIMNSDTEEKRVKRIQTGNNHSWTTCVNLMYDKIKEIGH
ncbi:glycosyltransferase [Maribellus comscasis]|uniref:Glycosyltransferase n=1 Tax=Maribellus comscasis TaxID=2681766 RepID=A0A6I6JZV4_9BACT|nr:glycosyltransferase [Maribellus comscasis]QGY45692.1 glycosyltransferase [Maribellus comscasis]